MVSAPRPSRDSSVVLEGVALEFGDQRPTRQPTKWTSLPFQLMPGRRSRTQSRRDGHSLCWGHSLDDTPAGTDTFTPAQSSSSWHWTRLRRCRESQSGDLVSTGDIVFHCPQRPKGVWMGRCGVLQSTLNRRRGSNGRLRSSRDPSRWVWVYRRRQTTRQR